MSSHQQLRIERYKPLTLKPSVIPILLNICTQNLLLCTYMVASFLYRIGPIGCITRGKATSTKNHKDSMIVLFRIILVYNKLYVPIQGQLSNMNGYTWYLYEWTLIFDTGLSTTSALYKLCDRTLVTYFSDRYSHLPYNSWIQDLIVQLRQVCNYPGSL